jgi:co-chaperonin GroES (HSP10)
MSDLNREDFDEQGRIYRRPGTSVHDLTDEQMFFQVINHEELNLDIKGRKRWPRPHFEVTGRRFLVIQDTTREKIGSIFIPDTYKKKHAVTSGIIVGVGDGYEDGALEEWNPPHGVGDRILWSRYNDTEIEVDVDRDWWLPEELERKTPDQLVVKFLIVIMPEILGRVL